jgi:superfamily II DNA or RNA helicase
MINPNSSRTLWQKSVIENWKQVKAKGYIEAATGVGKSYIAILAIKECNSRHSEAYINVIVPTTKLLEDWTGYWTGKGKSKKWVKGHIEIHNLKNVRVYVVNTYVTSLHECALLIMDECHRYSNESSDTFKTVIQRTKFNWALALSATLEFKHKQFLEERGFSSCGKVTAKEAMNNGWISEYKVLCVPIHLSEYDREVYDKMHSEFNKHFAMFNFDFQLAMKCVTDSSERNRLANELGWKIERVNAATFNWNRNMRMRKDFLYHVESKIVAAAQIANHLKLQTILFGQSQKGADQIAEMLGNECVLYHSKLKSSQKKDAIKKLTDGRTKVKYISSCKALEEGFNVEGLELGICWSRTSKSLRATQTLGRICRFVEGKTAYFIELYVPDTQDERWLKESLKKQSNVFWLKRIEDIYNLIQYDIEKKKTISERI